MAELLTNTTDLTKVAAAIREKGGTSDQLVYPDGFVTAIQDIQTGINGIKIGTYTLNAGLLHFTIAKTDFQTNPMYKNLYVKQSNSAFGLLATSIGNTWYAMADNSAAVEFSSSYIEMSDAGTEYDMDWDLTNTSSSLYYEGEVTVYALPSS